MSKGSAAALGGDVGDGAAAELRVAAGLQDHDAVEAAVPDQAGVAGAGQRRPPRRRAAARRAGAVRQQRDERVVVEVQDRLRQSAGESRRQVGVHVVVGGHVQTLATRRLDEREVGGRALGRAPLGDVVRDLDRHAGTAPDGDGLRDGLEDGLALAAHVRGVDAAMAGDDAAEAHELVGVGEAPGRIDEARGEAVGAGAHGRVQQALHARELALGDGALGKAHDRQPQGAVADERGDVDGPARELQSLEILAEARPVPGDPADVPVVRPVVQRLVAVRRAQRRRRHAAVAGDVRGDALPHHGIGPRILQDGDVGVRVRVDEAGRDVAAAGVDDGAAAQRARRADGRDAVAAHGHVAVVPGVAAAVHDAAVGDDEVGGGHEPSAPYISYIW